MGRSSAFLCVIILVAFAPAPALADPPGPTDYLSEIVSIEPPVNGITVRMIGGDSFVELQVEPGIRVDVLGYEAEPYLRFLSSGVVEINDRAPTTYLNEDRFAETEIPNFAFVGAEPSWRAVASGGSYAWHDHRSHWMNEGRPLGSSPGDQILEAVIPMVVDGVDVEVTVISTWQPAPAPTPAILGGLVGMALVVATSRVRQPFLPLVIIGFTAMLATAVGLIAWMSVPAETEPPWWLWAVPATSAGLVGYSGWTMRRGAASWVLPAVAAVELALWAGLRWPWLVRAFLPTSLAFPLDRAVTAMTLVVGVGLGLRLVANVVEGPSTATEN